MSYAELKDEVCRLANWYKSKGVKKGDRVIIYAPMILELPIAMLACARIGAIHSVVFGGFSADALAQRIIGSECGMSLHALPAFARCFTPAIRHEDTHQCSLVEVRRAAQT